MPNFIITYHGGSPPESEEEGEKVMAEWMAWIESVGSALIDPGNPVGITTVLGPKGILDERPKNPLMGYSMVEADNMEAVVGIMNSNPHLKDGGILEISEIIPMP